MGSLYERIEGMCKERGISITDMCRESKAPRGSLGDLKKGRIAKLSIDTLEKLSAYFSVPIEYILGTEENADPGEGVSVKVTEDELRLLNMYRNASDRKKSLIMLVSEEEK